VNIQKRILKCVKWTNWLLFVVATACGFLFFSPAFAKGIFFGGLIVTVNFHLLARTLQKALTPPHIRSHNVVLVKYYVRFIVSGFIIFVLISKHIVNPLGLFIGLSVVVASILIATMCELKNLIVKEAT
jgi:hypothetical protein